MNTNVVISLDTRRKKQDGTFPLVLRLGHNRRTIPLSLGISLKKEDWDDNKRVIKRSPSGSETVARLNNFIQKQKSEAMATIIKLSESNELDNLSISELKDKLHQPKEFQSFFSFAEQLVLDLRKANRFGTANSYDQVLRGLKKFNGNKELLFKDLNYNFLIRYETDHFGKGNSANGLAVYLRAIRSIYNKAIKSGLAEKDLYPFDSYKIKTTATKKRALDKTFLEKIFNTVLDKAHPCFHARNYFIASYMLYGMNFKDMALIKKSDIKDGRVNYRRSKSKKIYDIKITPQLKIILDFYSELNSDNDHIFPIIKRVDPQLQEKDILWARKRYNKKLKTLAVICGIENNLTSYVSRHSFATQAMLLEVPINAISAMLGHSSIKTTQVYLKTLPSSVLDEYNEKILTI